MAVDPGEKHLQRVRKICTAMPEATEKLSHGEPTFFVRVGVRGWIGIELSRISDVELTSLIREAWRMVAPKTLQN